MGALASVDVDKRDLIVSRNPATGEVLGEVREVGAAEIRDAVSRARGAQAAWGALPVQDRCTRVARFRDLVVARAEELCALIAAETGKTRAEALSMEVMVIADLATYFVKRAPRILAPEPISLHLLKNRGSYLHYAPRGVVGIISPWNFPFAIATGEMRDGADRRQRGGAQAVGGHAAHRAQDQGAVRRRGPADRAVPGGHRARRRRRGAHRQRHRLLHLHRLDRDRKEGRRRLRRAADPVRARARRQGAGDRLRRRRPRAHGARAGLGRVRQPGPGVRLGRARLRASGGARRAGAEDRSAEAATELRPGERHRLDDLGAPGRDRRGAHPVARSRTAPRCAPAASVAPAKGSPSRRRCSPTAARTWTSCRRRSSARSCRS